MQLLNFGAERELPFSYLGSYCSLCKGVTFSYLSSYILFLRSYQSPIWGVTFPFLTSYRSPNQELRTPTVCSYPLCVLKLLSILVCEGQVWLTGDKQTESELQIEFSHKVCHKLNKSLILRFSHKYTS